ncbi:MAG: hypothetical protein SH850_06180 [Planctomycetaceae bacterium]|nr:hypothetical protein [Planctomycetaceae bacterium]
MQVRDLTEYLAALSAPVRASGGAKPAQDLAETAAALEPFGAYSVPALVELLRQAEAFLRDGTLPPPIKGHAAKSSPAAVDSSQTQRELAAFYESVVQPAVSYSDIEGFVKQLDKRLKKDEAVQVARSFGIQLALKSKKDAIAAIRQKLIERKQALQRSDF